MLSAITGSQFVFLSSGKTCVQLHGLGEDKLFTRANVTHTPEHKISFLPISPRVLHICTQSFRTAIHRANARLTEVFPKLSTLSTYPITTTKYKKKRGRGRRT